MTVIGIDPASTRLAFATTGGLTAKYILGKRYTSDCCYRAWSATGEFLEMLLLDPGEVGYAFIEEPVVGGGGIRSSLVQAFTSGAVQAALIAAGFSVYLTHPSTWKSALFGRPGAKKDEIQRALQGQYPALASGAGGDPDIIDATCLALYGERVVGRSALVPGSP